MNKKINSEALDSVLSLAKTEGLSVSSNLQAAINEVVFHFTSKAEENERMFKNFKLNLKIDSTQNAALNRKLRQITQENKEIKLELANSESLIESLEAKITKSQAELLSVRKRTVENKLSKILEQENDSLKIRLEELENALTEENEKTQLFKSNLTAKETELRKIQGENTRFQREIDDLTSRYEEEKTILLDQVEEDCEGKVVELQKLNEKLERQLNKVKSQLSTVQNKIEESEISLETKQSEVDQLEIELNNQISQNSALKAANLKIEESNKKLVNQQESVSSLLTTVFDCLDIQNENLPILEQIRTINEKIQLFYSK